MSETGRYETKMVEGMLAAFGAYKDGDLLSSAQFTDALNRLVEMSKRIRELEEVLQWYGEQARLARLIHSEGDAGRQALAADGGQKAKKLLESDV